MGKISFGIIVGDVIVGGIIGYSFPIKKTLPFKESHVGENSGLSFLTLIS